MQSSPGWSFSLLNSSPPEPGVKRSFSYIIPLSPNLSRLTGFPVWHSELFRVQGPVSPAALLPPASPASQGSCDGAMSSPSHFLPPPPLLNLALMKQLMHSFIYLSDQQMRTRISKKRRVKGSTERRWCPTGGWSRVPGLWQTFGIDHCTFSLARFRCRLRILNAIPQAASTRRLRWRDPYCICR